MIAVDAGVTINVEVTELWMSVEKIKLVNDSVGAWLPCWTMEQRRPDELLSHPPSAEVFRPVDPRQFLLALSETPASAVTRG
jgi:hypothetical protein